MYQCYYHNFYRVLSRVCMAPFLKPSTAPTTAEHQEAYDELDDLLLDGLLSPECGWAIRQVKVLENKEKLKEMKSHLRAHFQGRLVHNWALLALCLKEVRDVQSIYGTGFHTGFLVVGGG